MKAAIPSTASDVRIRSSKYSRSSLGSVWRTWASSPSLTAAAACRMADADLGTRCSTNQRSTAVSRVLGRRDQFERAPSSATPRRSGSAPVTIVRVARATPTRAGSSAAPAGGKTPSRTSGSPSCAVSAAKMTSHASASSNPPPRQRPRTIATVRAGASSRVLNQLMHHVEHLPDSIRRVLRNAGAEAEIGTVALDRDELQMRIGRNRIETGPQRVDHVGRDDVPLRVADGERRTGLVGVEAEADERHARFARRYARVSERQLPRQLSGCRHRLPAGEGAADVGRRLAIARRHRGGERQQACQRVLRLARQRSGSRSRTEDSGARLPAGGRARRRALRR